MLINYMVVITLPFELVYFGILLCAVVNLTLFDLLGLTKVAVGHGKCGFVLNNIGIQFIC